jgi:hypothetical protein
VLLAATAVAISCGTNYSFSFVLFFLPTHAEADQSRRNSSWAPQLANQLGLSSTQTNVIGAGGNLGVYLSCSSLFRPFSQRLAPR